MFLWTRRFVIQLDTWNISSQAAYWFCCLICVRRQCNSQNKMGPTVHNTVPFFYFHLNPNPGTLQSKLYHDSFVGLCGRWPIFQKENKSPRLNNFLEIRRGQKRVGKVVYWAFSSLTFACAERLASRKVWYSGNFCARQRYLQFWVLSFVAVSSFNSFLAFLVHLFVCWL